MAIIPLVSGEGTEYVYRQNDVVDLTISCFDGTNNYCSDTTNCNITIFYPNSTLLVNNQKMSYGVSYYNYTIQSNQTKVVGEYSVVAACFDVENGYSTFNYDITPSGNKDVTQAESIILFIPVLIIIIIAFFFIFLFSKCEHAQGKVIFITMSILFLFIAILQSVTTLEVINGKYAAILMAYSSFFLVIKVLVSLGALVLVLYSGYLGFMIWLTKRGHQE